MVPAGPPRGGGRHQGDRPLLITPGDPAGVGPEVTTAALASLQRRDVVVVGDASALWPWGERFGLPLQRVSEPVPLADAVAVLDPGGAVEPVEVASIRLAVEACRTGAASALVTGPIHKGRLAQKGFHHAGHTDFLGELCGVERPVMAFVGGRVQVVLVTVHHPLAAVPALLDESRVLHTIEVAHAALVEQLGVPRPRLVVCGLNPHASDGGLLGSEEARLIAPAVARARSAGIDAVGPISAEGAFREAVRGRADMVVAMYHDQGLAPLKALEAARVEEANPADRAVNWTLGLPIVRTSVDHGTADDIAGEGVADPGSMIAAILLAERLVGRRGHADRRSAGYDSSVP